MHIQKVTPNNNPNFGMAIRMPIDTKSIESFSKDVFGVDFQKITRKGLNKAIAKQAQNANYDIRYASGTGDPKGSSFQVFRKGDCHTVAKYYVNETEYPNSFERKLDKYAREVENELSTSAKSYLSTRAILSLLKESLMIRFFKQDEMLPAALRKACDKASELDFEKRINITK